MIFSFPLSLILSVFADLLRRYQCPRTQSWDNHFSQNNHHIEGLTPEGRTTAKLLQFNTQERIAERQRLTT